MNNTLRFDNTSSSLEYRKNLWLKQCHKAHGSKFNYSKIIFKNQNSKVNIICSQHGIFKQRAVDHSRSKHGCPKCATLAGIEKCKTIINENGLNVFQQSGIRLNNLLSPEQRKKNAEKAKQTKIKKGIFISDNNLKPWKLYKRLVYKTTRNQALHKLIYIEKRGFGKDYYNLDHMYSIIDGFNNNISSDIIGHICNLRMIPFNENRRKYIKSCITLEQLYKRINKGEIE